MKHNNKALVWLNIAAFALTLAVNGLAELIPINGVKTGEVSLSYPNLFTPADITFAIWGVIYLLLLGFVLYQAGVFTKHDAPAQAASARVGGLFIASSLLNSAWILAWHYYRIGLSLLIMAALLVTLALTYVRVYKKPLSEKEKLFVGAPFSAYFAWISVATISNAAAYLVSVGWAGLGLPEASWTIIMITVGLALGLLTVLTRRDAIFGLVMAWAYAGIVIRHAQATGFDGAYPAILWTAASAAFILLMASLGMLLPREKKA